MPLVALQANRLWSVMEVDCAVIFIFEFLICFTFHIYSLSIILALVFHNCNLLVKCTYCFYLYLHMSYCLFHIFHVGGRMAEIGTQVSPSFVDCIVGIFIISVNCFNLKCYLSFQKHIKLLLVSLLCAVVIHSI